jgi:hypothetical protein
MDVSEEARIELTLRLWGTGAPASLDEYVTHLTGLLPRHRGRLERQVSEVEAGPGAPDVLLVLSFPDGPSVDGFLRDPLRADADDLAARAVSRALITDSRHRAEPDGDTAEVVPLRAAHDDPLNDGA